MHEYSKHTYNVNIYVRTYVLYVHMLCTYIHTYIHVRLYPGVWANYGWIKGKSVLTFVM